MHHSRWAREPDWDRTQAVPEVRRFPSLERGFSEAAGAYGDPQDDPAGLAEDILPDAEDAEPNILTLDDEPHAGAQPCMQQQQAGPCPDAPVSPFALLQMPPANRQPATEQPVYAAASYPPLQQQDWQSGHMQPTPSLTLGGSDWQERCRSGLTATTPAHPWAPQQQPSATPVMGAGGLGRAPSFPWVRSGVASVGRSESVSSPQRGLDTWQHGVFSSLLSAYRSSSLKQAVSCSLDTDASMEDISGASRQLSIKTSLSPKVDCLVSM